MQIKIILGPNETPEIYDRVISVVQGLKDTVPSFNADPLTNGSEWDEGPEPPLQPGEYPDMSDPVTNGSELPPGHDVLGQMDVVPGPAPGTVELDSAGHYWDANIHSGGKTQKANGTWNVKRGVDKGVVEQALAMQHVGTPQAQPVSVAPVSTTPEVDPAAVFGGATAAPVITDITWPDVLQRCQAKGLDQATVDAWCTMNGLASFNLLVSRPDLFGPFLTAMGA